MGKQPKHRFKRYTIVQFIAKDFTMPLSITTNGYISNSRWLLDLKVFDDPILKGIAVKERMFGKEQVVDDDQLWKDIKKIDHKYREIEFKKEIYAQIRTDIFDDVYIYKSSIGNKYFINKRWMYYLEQKIDGICLMAAGGTDPIKIYDKDKMLIGLVMGYRNIEDNYDQDEGGVR